MIPLFFPVLGVGIASSLGQLMLALAGSFAYKIMAALGIGIFTYGAVSFAIDDLVVLVQQRYNGMSTDALALLNMAGFGEGIGIIAGGYVTASTIKAVNNVFVGLKK